MNTPRSPLRPRRAVRHAFFAAAALFAAAPVLAAPPVTRRPAVPAPAPLRPQSLAAHEYLPTSRLKAGMTGYGLTVFKGTKIERFDVTVLGVLRKINNGKDLILVRLKGGPVTKRYANVAAGMSGSPVYVNGRIIGAVAYAPAFAREPLGFLTPIEDMLEAWDPDLPQSPMATRTAALPARPAGPVTLPAAVSLGGGRSLRSVRFAAPGEENEKDAPGTITLSPLMTPVSVSGVGWRQMPAVAKMLAPLGLRPSAVPGGARVPAGSAGSAMLPGGAVGVSLATGDLDMTAIGTLTYRRGDKIVAFGHPFTGFGPIDAPLFSAYILDVLPSYNESEKLGSPVALVGRVFQDRPFSIGGQIGARPVMVPVAIDINDRSTHRVRHFRAQILRHPLLTPRLAVLAATGAIQEVHGQPGDAMARVTMTVEADEVGKITRRNLFFDPGDISEAATGDLVSLVGTLAGNPFYPLAVRSIRMSVTIEPRRDTAQIERIFLKQTRFEPGETVNVGVVLKPYKREREVRTVQVKIPSNIPSGTTLALLVQGGGASSGLSSLLGGGGLVLGGGPGGGGAGGPASVTVQQFVRRWQEREANDELVARLLLPTAAVNVGGEKLSNLPPAIADAMRAGGGRSTGLRLERDEVKVRQTTPFVLAGLQALSVRVAKKGVPPPAAPGAFSVPVGGADDNNAPAPPPGGTVLRVPASGGGDDDLAARAVFAQVGLPAPPPVLVAPPDDETDEEDDTTPAAPPPGVKSAAPTTLASPTTLGGGASADATKPVNRLAGVWRQATAADFRAGTLDGVTVTSLGDVRRAPSLRVLAESTDAFFWCLASDEKGGVFAGTGDNGLVYQVAPDGKRTVFARTGELQVHALVRAADGTLYAGTSPNGRVLKITPTGKVSTLFQTKEPYVLALALSGDGVLYAATGGGTGRVYRITPQSGNGGIVYEGAEAHVTALAFGPDGASLYAGTAPGGLVLKIAGPGVARPAVLYDSSAETASITGLGVDNTGSVWAATAPRGLLVKLDPANVVPARVVYDKAPGALSNLQIAHDNTVWFASQAAVYALAPGSVVDAEPVVRSFDAPSDIQILSVLRAPDGRVFASTGNVGGVYAVGGTATEAGTLMSSVFDAKAPARWGTLRWTASGPPPVLETRSGDTPDPDAAWSVWTPAQAAKVASPPARFLQYRARLSETDTTLRTVEVFYKTRNQPPVVAIAAPQSGDVWRGTKTLKWSGTDPDRDTLSYEVELSGDGGKTWNTAKPAAATSTPPSSKPAPAKPAPAATLLPLDEDTTAKVNAQLDKYPTLSPETRARIVAQARAMTAQKNATPAAPPTRQTSLSLDTTRWPDGVYLLRVVATDRAANPDEPQTGERVSGEFRIVNKPPTISVAGKTAAPTADRTVRVAGVATHPSGLVVRAVQFRVDTATDWTAAVAADGLFDSPNEPFTLTTPGALTPGAHTLEVQAQDEAGNTTTQKTTITVR